MTRFKLALMLGFVFGWAVGTGRAQELWRRVRGSSEANMTFGGSMQEPVVGGRFEVRPESATTRIASA